MGERRTIFHSLSGAGWQVWSVRTANSTYHVGLCRSPQTIATLTTLTGAPTLIAQDSAPRIGDASLFDVAPESWVGQQLRIGHVETSPISEVEKETATEAVSVVIKLSTLAPLARTHRAEPEPEPSYPESHVLYLEWAAAYLRRVYASAKLLDDLAQRPNLSDRFAVALGECALSIEALVRKAKRRKSPDPG